MSIMTTVWMGALHLKSNAAVTFCGDRKVSDAPQPSVLL